MAKKYPIDRFDGFADRPARVGAHRAAPKSFRRLRFALWSVLAAAVLTGIGIGGVVVIDNGMFRLANDVVGTPSPTARPTIDPNTPIIVLNGTPTDTLDDSAAVELRTAGFTVESATNADKTDLVESAVYYTGPDFEAVARAAANALGITRIAQSSTFAAIGSNITVVLGSDFVPTAVG